MDLETKRKYYQLCDPGRALTADDVALYEDFDQQGLRGPDAPARRLLQTILLSSSPTTQLFSGLNGSGKSTELNRLSVLARQRGYFTVSPGQAARDAMYLRRSEPVEAPDVLFALCIAIDEALSVEGHRIPGCRDTLLAWWSSLFARIKLDEVAITAGPVEAKWRISSEPDFRHRVNAHVSQKPYNLKEAVHAFVASAADAVLNCGIGAKLVVVLDELEKVGITITDRTIGENAHRHMWLDQVELMRVPCDVVYSVPPVMIQHAPVLGGYYDAEPVFLPMVRLLDHTTNIPDECGISAMLSALNRRIPLSETFESMGDAREMVLKSGGVMRDLWRFVREGLAACPDQCDRFPSSVVAHSIQRVRWTYREGLFEEYKEPLLQTNRNKRFPLTKGTQTMYSDLSRSHMLLRYHNGDEWYDVHPLVLDLLMSPGIAS